MRTAFNGVGFWVLGFGCWVMNMRNTDGSKKYIRPLLSEEEKSKADIATLSYDFACRVIRLYRYLAHSKESVMSKQVYRSGTSIGANIHEAQNAQSKPDFLSKMAIASKEANETDYWLRLLHDNGYIDSSQFKSLDNDIKRLLRIIVSIVKTTKENINK